MLHNHDDFIEKLKDPDEYLSDVAYEYPEYKKEILELLKQEEKFISLIRDAGDLANLANHFKDDEQNQLFLLFKETDSFHRLVDDLSSLGNLICAFPNHNNDFFEMMSKPAEFERLVKDKNDLSNMALYFKNHKHASIFNEDSPDVVLKKMGELNKAEKAYTKGAATGALASSTPALPPEVGYHIGSFLDRKTGGRLAQTSKTAAETAEEEVQKNKKPSK